MWSLRDFEQEDLFDTIQLANEILGEAYSSELFTRIAELYPDGFIVAEVDGEVVGFIMGVVSVPAVARVLILAVDEDHQNEGIGSALLETFTRRFTKGGVDRVRLEVRESNDAAQRFYRRHGFEVEGVLPAHYRDGENACVMTRPIDADAEVEIPG